MDNAKVVMISQMLEELKSLRHENRCDQVLFYMCVAVAIMNLYLICSHRSYPLAFMFGCMVFQTYIALQKLRKNHVRKMEICDNIDFLKDPNTSGRIVEVEEKL